MGTFTGAIGTGAKWAIDRIVVALAATGINPNLLTFLGLVVNFAAAANFAYMGLLVYYSVSGRTPYVVLAAVATAGSVMVSYTRARAESLIPLCKVGFMERPERLVLLMIGGLFNRMAQVLWVIAIVSTLTVIHRIFFTWQETKAGRILPSLKPSA
jgi:CDP-diacylglycerol--glycerol-3-phosphate 3-phosphatidyltransferase